MAEFKWFGHNCFRIKGREATVLCDPVDRTTGYLMAKQTADIVTLSHDHSDQASLATVKPEYKLVHGPGEYEIHDIFITGIRTFRDDSRGKERGFNTVYVFELEGLVICHLGDLGHALTDEQAEAMNHVDILLIPAGGGNVLSPAKAAELVSQIEPKLVIPMQYATEIGDTELAPLSVFCKELGVEPPAADDKLVVKPSDLGESLRLAALKPDSEPAGRGKATRPAS